MKIFLVGFMGCGKSTIGRKLANKLGWDFIDLDKLIEGKSGTSIANYFEKYGEKVFRELEKESLQLTQFPDNTVIATGGGAPCYEDNMEWMNRNGLTLYINLSPKALVDRLKHGKDERPLIRNFDNEQLLEFITGKLAERSKFYEKATHVFSGIDLTAEVIFKKLKAKS